MSKFLPPLYLIFPKKERNLCTGKEALLFPSLLKVFFASDGFIVTHQISGVSEINQQ